MITLTSLISILVRRWRFACLVFAGIELGLFLYISALAPFYTSTIKLMLNRGRIDSVVTTDDEARPRQSASVTVEELNTELELLQSRDLLRKVVQACGLQEVRDGNGIWKRLQYRLGLEDDADPVEANEEIQIARSAARLRANLDVAPVRQSNLIELTYSSSDPESAARVLNSLAELYLEKHMEVHRPPGTFEFYQREAEQSQQQLQDLEDRIVALASRPEGASPQLMKEELLRTGAEFESSLKKTMAEIAVSKERIITLEGYVNAAPRRGVSQVRTSSRIPDHLQSTLLELELRRTELLKVFQPTNARVQVVENQMEQTRRAIEEYKHDTAIDEVTQPDPTHEWAQSELMKETARLAGLKAQYDTIQNIISEYRGKIGHVSRLEFAEHDLKRQAELAEKHYMLYLRKQEDARISDELDRHRIVNLVVVESAAVPYSPSGPPKRLFFLLGTIFAAGLSLVIAISLDWVEPWIDATARKPFVRQLLRPAA